MAKKKLKNIPRTRGETHLAYITAAEEALLRARDKKKGAKKRKFSPEGIPVLQVEPEWDIQQEEETKARGKGRWESVPDVDRGGHHGGQSVWVKDKVTKVTADTTEEEEEEEEEEEVVIETGDDDDDDDDGGGDDDSGVEYVAPVKKVTPPAEDRPEYTGPAHDPNESITPTGITLQPVQDAEFVENRLNDLLDKNSPLFRNAAEARLRSMAGRGLGRNASMAQEEVMKAIFAVAGPIAEADARMLERHRTLNNTAYFQQMNTRLQGVIQKALTHIAGGYDIQAATMKDITDRWKAQLDSDLKEYGVDVSAAVSKYGTDVGFAKTKYVADITERLGLSGIKVNAAEILAGIEDNTESATYIWDLIFGENMNISDWIVKWKDHWEDEEED